MTAHAARFVPVFGLAILGACAGNTDPGPADPAEEAAGRRAALAHVAVENRTSQRLTIAFRPGAGPGNEVVIGEVAARSTVALAPVPAGEPIRLYARNGDGETFELPPRSFSIGADWVWVIPADARFVPSTITPS